MEDDVEMSAIPPSLEESGWRSVDYAAMIFLAVSGVAWLMALPIVAMCFGTIQADPKGDGMIGVYVVAMFAGAAGSVMLLVAMILSALAHRLPIWLRLLCLVPGALALLFAGYSFAV